MDCSVFIVPVEVGATIELTFPINVDVIILFESMFEVLGMGKVDGLDAKVVYHKAEGDGVTTCCQRPGVYWH